MASAVYRRQVASSRRKPCGIVTCMDESGPDREVGESLGTLPSLELIAGAVAGELEALTHHVEALDTKAGVILGFAGVLAGLAVSRGQPIAQLGIIIDVVAGLLAVFAFLPRKWPVLRAKSLREKYLTAQATGTQLHLLDTRIAMVEEASDLLARKGKLVTYALVSLMVAIALIVGGGMIPVGGFATHASRPATKAAISIRRA